MFMLFYLFASISLFIMLVKTLRTIYREKQRRIVKRYLVFLLASIILYGAFPGYFVGYLVYYFSYLFGAPHGILDDELTYWGNITVQIS